MPTIREGSWTELSLEWIAKQRAAMPAASSAELERHCRQNYPFQMRKGWAYKAWLKAMRFYFRPGPDGRPVLQDKRCPKTSDLFNDGEPTC